MRKYQLIWITLKTTGRAEMQAAPDRHKTIIQAVKKERSKDVPFRKAENVNKKAFKIVAETLPDGYTLVLKLVERKLLKNVL